MVILYTSQPDFESRDIAIPARDEFEEASTTTTEKNDRMCFMPKIYTGTATDNQWAKSLGEITT